VDGGRTRLREEARKRGHAGAPSEESNVVPSEVTSVGALLDADHTPETNGRMAVCRRCGAKTDGPDGRHHVPDESRVARANEWLDAQHHRNHVERARATFDK
jgi:hypothetical protein